MSVLRFYHGRACRFFHFSSLLFPYLFFSSRSKFFRPHIFTLACIYYICTSNLYFNFHRNAFRLNGKCCFLCDKLKLKSKEDEKKKCTFFFACCLLKSFIGLMKMWVIDTRKEQMKGAKKNVIDFEQYVLNGIVNMRWTVSLQWRSIPQIHTKTIFQWHDKKNMEVK